MARGSFLHNRIVLLAILCMMLPLAAASGQVYPDPNISLDSRVYSSDLVIEGRLVEPIKDPAVKDAPVRITAVYRGAAKVGDVILVVRIGDFEKPAPASNSNMALQPKDDLILFLNRPRAGIGHVHFDGPAYVLSPLFWNDPEAFRLVLRGGIYSFYETPSFRVGNGISPYPPYVAATRADWPGAVASPEDTVLAYRQHLRESATRVLAWHDRLDLPATTADIPWLISLLKERYVPPAPQSGGFGAWYYNADAVAADAANRLAELRDLPASIQAIAANPDYVTDFSHVFASPRGRDCLLDGLKDRSLGMPLRRSIRYLVEMAGLDYSANSPRLATTRPFAGEEKIIPRNGSYLARIAQIAADASAAGDDQISSELLSMLNSQFSGSRDGNREVQIQLDLDDAAEILRRIYAKSTSGEIRFRVENAMYAIGDKEFATLQSPCGAILTLTEPGNSNAHSMNSIALGYEYRRVRDGEPVTGSQVVLESVISGKSYIVPSSMAPQRDGVLGVSRYGEESLALPLGFKTGRYRVHYQLLNGTKVVDEGDGCELDLPQSASPPSAVTWIWGGPVTQSAKPWPRSRKIAIGIFPFVIAALLLLRALIRSGIQRRRARKGQCPQCGYDLRFSSGRCTECGRPISAKVSPRLVRRSLARIIWTTSALLTVATAVFWVRSHYVADCWVRTTAERADSVYFSRGAMVLNLFTTVGDPGWRHLRAAPLALPRTTAESGDLPRWSVFGIEYSSLSQMLIVPLWAVFLASTLCGLLMTHRLRRLRGGG